MKKNSLPLLRTWLSNKGDLYSRFAIVDSWLQEADGGAAKDALADIPNRMQLTDEEEVEYDYFYTLKNLQIDAVLAAASDQQMVSSNLAVIVTIAEAGEYYASVQAQALLNEYADSAYQGKTTLPAVEQQSIFAPPVGNLVMEGLALLDTVPNPAKDVVEFRYRFDDSTANAKIVIATIEGRIVGELTLDGASGLVTWKTKNLPEGVYVYSLNVGRQTLITKRLVILR